MNQKHCLRNHPLCRIIMLLMFLCFYLYSYAGWKPSIHTTVGETFTVNSTYHSRTQSVSWNWDTGVLELVGDLYETSTSATFRVKKATPMSGVAIQATTYYHGGHTSVGVEKEVDHWTVFAEDDSRVSLNSSSMSMNVGSHRSLTAHVSNSSYGGECQWTTSNSNVVSLSGWNNKERTLHAERSGHATIRVTLDNGNYAECSVTVKDVKPTGINLTSELSVYLDETKSIHYSILPEGAISDVTWWSDDASIAEVSPSGVVTGMKVGTTKVWAKTSKGGFTDYCKVSVTEPLLKKVSSSPSNQEKNVSRQIHPSVQFNIPIFRSSAFNQISLKEVSTDERVQGKVLLDGKTLRFVPAEDLYSATAYILTIPDNAVKNKWNTGLAERIHVRFTTEINPKDLKYFLVWDKQGGCVSFLLEERPRISYDLNNALIHCETTNQNMDFSLKEVHKYTLDIVSGPQTGIEQFVENSKENGDFFRQPNTLLFEKFSSGTNIRVYSLNGRLLQTYQVDSSGRLTISTQNWEPSVYLIYTGIATYKIIKK